MGTSIKRAPGVGVSAGGGVEDATGIWVAGRVVGVLVSDIAVSVARILGFEVAGKESDVEAVLVQAPRKTAINTRVKKAIRRFMVRFLLKAVGYFSFSESGVNKKSRSLIGNKNDIPMANMMRKGNEAFIAQPTIKIGLAVFGYMVRDIVIMARTAVVAIRIPTTILKQHRTFRAICLPTSLILLFVAESGILPKAGFHRFSA